MTTATAEREVLHQTIDTLSDEAIISLVPYVAFLRQTRPQEYTSLDEGYRAMAADREREAEAIEWCNALIGDVADEAR
jgi:hypothetical protein